MILSIAVDPVSAAALVLASGIAAQDQALLEAVQAWRWGPLTALFVLASAWWVKGLVFVGAGALHDAVTGRRFPRAATVTAMAVGVVSVLTTTIKDLVERARPFQADPSIVPLQVPGGYSFPSGHASMAFAAATAVALMCPRLRWPALGLAALVAASRVYLGVHYAVDIAAGALLGAAVGYAVVRLSTAVARRV